MRVAIFSDVHGNIMALEAVLADIASQGPFDRIAFAGDLVYGGAQPRECIELLRTHNIVAVYGNTDLFLWEPLTMPENVDEKERANWETLFNTIAWTNEQIGAQGMSYLQALPFKLRLTPDDVPEHGLLVVHANPVDVMKPILPSETIQKEVTGEVTQPDADVLPLLAGVAAKTVAFGHVHVPNVRHVGGYTLANISSVSRPQDEDWRAKWAILEFTGDHWEVTHRYVEYDVQTARQATLDSQMPHAEQVARALLLPD